MAITKTVTLTGTALNQSQSGNVFIDDQQGQIIIRNPSDGLRRILIGSHPVDGHTIEAVSDPGVDVITALGG